jgi:hypothetical protein
MQKTEKPTLKRRPRAATTDYYAEPGRPDWVAKDWDENDIEDERPDWVVDDWNDVEEECYFESDFSEELKDTICKSVSNYFYKHDIKLSEFNLAEAQEFLARLKDTAVKLSMLLSANPALPAITGTRDVLGYQLFDISSPLSKSHLEHSSEPAHEALFDFNPLDDVTRQIDHLIDATTAVMADNVVKAAAKADNVELSAWDEMICEIAQALESAGMSAGAKNDSSKGASNFVLLMLALTRRMPEKYRQHHKGDDGEESQTAMAGAINKARAADRKRRDAIAAARARKSSKGP